MVEKKGDGKTPIFTIELDQTTVKQLLPLPKEFEKIQFFFGCADF